MFNSLFNRIIFYKSGDQLKLIKTEKNMSLSAAVSIFMRRITENNRLH